MEGKRSLKEEAKSMSKQHYISIRQGIFAGVASGIILGLFLKWIEQTTNHKVYTLLLNVDYIPLLMRLSLNESVEFALHLVISIVISLFFVWLLRRSRWSPRENFSFIVAISLLIGILLFPTTMLSTRTPELTDFGALFYWIIGHVLYGGVLGFLLVIVNPKKRLLWTK
jgi:magnesium-transporting ATPase (P-type)